MRPIEKNLMVLVLEENYLEKSYKIVQELVKISTYRRK